MKKPLTMLAVAGALAVAAAPAGAAKPTDKGPSGHETKVPSAQKQCRDERSAMGRETFAQTYGTNRNRSNALGKCVSKRNAATRDARKAARREAPKGHGHAKSGDVAKTVAGEVKADINAAKTCKAQRKADADAFAEDYGTRRNAFGKCVSRTAREAHGS